MATELQKRAFNLRMKRIENKKPIVMGEVMREAGFSQASSENPQQLVKTKGWRQLMAEVDDEVVVNRIREILVDDDKRSSLTAADMLLKLKDRYPSSQSKMIGIFGDMSKLSDKEKGEKDEKPDLS